MKTINLLAASLFLIMLAGCNQPKPQPVQKEPMETVDTVSGVAIIREIHVLDSIKIAGTTYTYQYDMTPLDTLPKVRNSSGFYYKENQVAFLVKKGSNVIFKRTFTKSDFAQIVPADMLKTSTLVGFTYNHTVRDPKALNFIVTVGDPDITSDDLLPMDMVITALGEYSIKKAEHIETEPIQQGMTIDPSTDDGV